MPISSDTAQGKNFLYTSPKSKKSVPGGQSSIDQNTKKPISTNESIKISSGDSIVDTWKISSIESSLANMGISSVRPEIISSLEFLPPIGADTNSIAYATGVGELIDMQSQLKRIKYTEAQRFLIKALNSDDTESFISLEDNPSGPGNTMIISEDCPWFSNVGSPAEAYNQSEKILNYLDDSLVLYRFIDSLNIKNQSYKKSIISESSSDINDSAEKRIASHMSLFSDDIVGNKVPGRIGLKEYMVGFLGYPQAWWKSASSTGVSLQLLADSMGRTVMPIIDPVTGMTQNDQSILLSQSASTIFGINDMADTSDLKAVRRLKLVKPKMMSNVMIQTGGGDEDLDQYASSEAGTGDKFTKGDFQKIWDMIFSENPLPLYVVAKDYMTYLSEHKIQGKNVVSSGATPLSNQGSGATSASSGYGGGYSSSMSALCGWTIYKSKRNFGDWANTNTTLTIGDTSILPFKNAVYIKSPDDASANISTLNNGNGDTPAGSGSPIPGREFFLDNFFQDGNITSKLDFISGMASSLQSTSDMLSNVTSWIVPHAWDLNDLGLARPTGMTDPSFSQPGCPASYFTDNVMMTLSTFLKKRVSSIQHEEGYNGEYSLGSPGAVGKSGWSPNQRLSAAIMMMASQDSDAAFELFRAVHLKDILYTGMNDSKGKVKAQFESDDYIKTFHQEINMDSADHIIAAIVEKNLNVMWDQRTYHALEIMGNKVSTKILEGFNFQYMIAKNDTASVTKFGNGYAEDGFSGGQYNRVNKDIWADSNRMFLHESQAAEVSSTSWDEAIDTYYKYSGSELNDGWFLGKSDTYFDGPDDFEPHYLTFCMGFGTHTNNSTVEGQSTQGFENMDFVWDLARKAVSSFEDGMAKAMGITNVHPTHTSAGAYMNKSEAHLDSGAFKINRGGRVCVAFILLCYLLNKTQKMAVICNPQTPSNGHNGKPKGIHFMWSRRAIWSYINAMSLRNKTHAQRAVELSNPTYKTYDDTTWPYLNESSKYGQRQAVEGCLDVIYSFIVPQLEQDMNVLNSAYFFSQFAKKAYTSAESVISTFSDTNHSDIMDFLLKDSASIDGSDTTGINLGNNLTEVLSKMLTKEQVTLARYLQDCLMWQNRDFPIFPASEVVMENQAKCLAVISRLGRLQEIDNAGQKRIMTVGIPSGMIESLRRAAMDSSGDSYFAKTKLLKISLWRRNLISEEIVETPQSFVFDISKFIVEGRQSYIAGPASDYLDTSAAFQEGWTIKDLIQNSVIRTYDESGCTQSNEGYAYTEAQRTKWIQNGGDIRDLGPEYGESWWGENEIVDMTDGQLLSYFGHLVSGENGSGIAKPTCVLDYVTINHIIDHYIKLYTKLTMGIDIRETTFPLSLDSTIDTYKHNSFLDSETFASVDTKLSLSYPTRDQAAAISYSRLREEAKRSRLLSPSIYRNRVVYPKTFDRVFSFVIDDSLWPGNSDLGDEIPDNSYGIPEYEQSTPQSAYATTKQLYPRYFQYFSTVSLLPDLIAEDDII